MEETKFKPSIKIEKVFLVIGVLFLITIILSPIGFFLIIGSLATMINKHFRTYTINNQNEIQDYFQFINKNSQVYRIDQITTLTLRQGLLEKIFKLGTISFGIFGKTILYANPQGGANSAQAYLRQKLITLTEYKDIFSKLVDLTGIPGPQDPLYEDKPSTKPIMFWMFIWLAFFILSFIIAFTLPLPVNIIAFILSFFFFIFFLTSYFIYLRTRSTKYTITKYYVKYEHDYFLSSKIEIMPLKKITNHKTNKNIISYALFKVGYLKIYTGGSIDPVLSSLEKYETFNDKLDNILRLAKGDSQSHSSLTHEQITDKINTSAKKETLFETKPGIGFVITLANVLFLLFSLITIIFIPIYLIYLIYKIILWKNTKYLFYEDKIVDISGVLNITQKEIYFKNIKHIKLQRKFLFEKLFNQGTIFIYTPGTGVVDNKIDSIKEFEEVYKDFREVIL